MTSSTAGADLLGDIFEVVHATVGTRCDLHVHVNRPETEDDDRMMGPWPAALVRIDVPWWWCWGREQRTKRLEAQLRERTGQWVQVLAG